MGAVAIITARGGSKRIPGKNVKEFCGSPIIAYSIRAALDSGQFETVMVSTDSREIAEIAVSYGAEVPFLRSERTSSDYATTADVLEEVLTEYRKAGKSFSHFACLYPTAPFITAGKLREAMKCFLESGADSLVSVVRFSFPPQRAFHVKDGCLAFLYPEYARARSQDLEPLYHDCGQFYIADTEAFLECHSLMTPRTIPFELPEEEVQDIDNESDWKIAEMKFSIMQEKGKQ